MTVTQHRAPPDYAATLLEQNAALAELLAEADLQAPVPTCPEWTMLQLLKHVGRGDRWAGQITAERRQQPLDPREVVGGKPPADTAGALHWLTSSPQILLQAVSDVGPDTPVWTFLGQRPSSWWVRRRLHEATVHRADVALARGLDYDLPPELAADGLEESLDVLPARPGDVGPPLAPGEQLRLVATDAEFGMPREWTVRGGADGINWHAGAADGADPATAIAGTDAAGEVRLTGRAVDLFLALVRRRAAEQGAVTIEGDAGIWRTWLERTPF